MGRTIDITDFSPITVTQLVLSGWSVDLDTNKAVAVIKEVDGNGAVFRVFEVTFWETMPEMPEVLDSGASAHRRCPAWIVDVTAKRIHGLVCANMCGQRLAAGLFPRSHDVILEPHAGGRHMRAKDVHPLQSRDTGGIGGVVHVAGQAQGDLVRRGARDETESQSFNLCRFSMQDTRIFS